MKVALIQEPVKIDITDSDSLLMHSRILTLRSKHRSMLNGEVEQAERAFQRAEYEAKKAKLALEAIKLEAQQLAGQERQAVTDLYTRIFQTNPEVRTLQERYGRGVTFMFDSDSHKVWIVAVFSNDAPPVLRDDDDYPGQEYPAISPDDDDGEHAVDSNDLEDLLS